MDYSSQMIGTHRGLADDVIPFVDVSKLPITAACKARYLNIALRWQAGAVIPPADVAFANRISGGNYTGCKATATTKPKKTSGSGSGSGSGGGSGSGSDGDADTTTDTQPDTGTSKASVPWWVLLAAAIGGAMLA